MNNGKENTVNKRKQTDKRKRAVNPRKPRWGYFWHIHHNRLLEWSNDIMERVRDIKTTKPKQERPIRLRWMTRVQGRLPKTLQEILDAHGQNLERYERAIANEEDLTDAEYALSDGYLASSAALNMMKDSGPYRALVRLHRREHRGCPWNGKELVFPKGNRK